MSYACLFAGAVSLSFSACRPSPVNTAIEDKSTDGKSTGRTAQPSDPPVEPTDGLTPNEILARLLKTYRTAKAYSDKGVITLSYRQQGEAVGNQWPSCVEFVRPNKFSLVAFQATVKCDGTRLRAEIDDPASNNVDNQTLDREAPKNLKLADLASDGLLYDILASQLHRQPIQLELLLESSGLASAFHGDIACSKREDAEFDANPCYVVEVPSPGGAFVFWIDKKSFVLRRLDYPVSALLPAAANDASITELSLSADLHEAKIGGDVAESTFHLEPRADAKLVQSFVVPPRPLPSDLFGEQPLPFHFTDPSGNRVTDKDLLNRVVLLTWYQDHPACEATLQQMTEAAKVFKDRTDVRFFAVNADPVAVGDDAVAERLKSWKVELPVVRDLEAFGDSIFSIKEHPTIVALDREGRVQIFQTGGNPQLAAQIGVIVERLLKGENLGAEIVKQAEHEREAYDKLIVAGGPAPTPIVELPEAVIHKRTEPAVLKLKKLWENTELRSPGNILAIDTMPPSILVCEMGRNVVQLDVHGGLVKRHALELPEGLAITYLRTAVDGDGRRSYVGSAPLAQAWYRFNEAWRLVSQYPANGEQPLQITDVCLRDLDDDKSPDVIVGNVNLLGLVAASLEGKELWRSRKFPNVTSVAATANNDSGGWGIFITGESGGVLRVNRFGNDEPEEQLKDWAIVRLTSADWPAARGGLLGLGTNGQGALRAIALGDNLQTLWNYDLPGGAHQRAIEPVTFSRMLNVAGEWWLAGPDGSIHVIHADGQFHDSFYFGEVLSGFAAVQLGESSVLLVATDRGVSAWAISK